MSWKLTCLLGLGLGLGAACHGAPCDRWYTGSEACDRLREAFLAVCPTDPPLDCAQLLRAQCAPPNRLCADGVDACAASVKAAPSCGEAGQVTCNLSCFE